MSDPTIGQGLGDGEQPAESSDAEGGNGAPPTRNERRLHRRAHRSHWVRRSLIALAALLVVGLALGGLAYIKLNGNIKRLDVSTVLGPRPTRAATTDKQTNLPPLNILVMGSDTRAGIDPNSGDGAEGDARSDTNLVVHLSADRKSAVVVSIPRDSMTKAPASCTDRASTVQNGVMRQWNANFTLGGPACVIKTLEGNTGIYIDHFVVMDFQGFKTMVDALGGVEVCTPEPINDVKAHLQLRAGRTKVNGTQALGFVRVRYSVGDGSDLGRINRQQAFLSSMVQEATRSSLLLRPDRLFRFLNAATDSMTADQDLNLSGMADIARSVSQLGTKEIKFVTVPTREYPADPNRVEWTPAASGLWASIREDKPLPGSSSTATATPSPTTSQVLTVKPEQITVRVTNDSGVGGLAKQASAALQAQGFKAGPYATGQSGSKGVVIRYGQGREDAARTVAAAFPGSTTRLDELLGSMIEVSVGLGASPVVAVPNRTGTAPLPAQPITAPLPTSTESITARSASEDICS